MIDLLHIQKVFNEGTSSEVTLFNDFNFHVDQGEFVSIVGSNGSGKTTLLNLVAGSVLPTSGAVYLNGQDITLQKEYVRAQRMGRVFQNPIKGVASQMTIAQNLSLAENKGKTFGFTKGLSRKKMNYYKYLVAGIGLGLEDRMDVPMGSLSGGQRQAVSLIMATLTPIDVLILDEHTAALDPHTADIIMEITDRIVREKNITTLMVTHNLRYATTYGSRLVMMDKGNVIVDKAGDEKCLTKTDDLLKVFNEISIECGN